MLKAIEYLGPVGVGVTSPVFCRADDQIVYIVKLNGNPLGNPVLVSEYLAKCIGESLGLIFPPSDLICIDDTLNKKDALLPNGLHFASRYIPNAKYVTRNNLLLANNIPQMAGVVLFDHIFHNADRSANRKNLLLALENQTHRLYAIDHSHLFRSGRWTNDSLLRCAGQFRSYHNYLYGVLLHQFLKPDDFSPYVEKIKATTKKDLQEFVNKIPEDWLPDHDTRTKLLDYICGRYEHIDDIMDTILEKIPH